MNCAGVHRSFGVAVSSVRSISLDSWTDKQLKMMSLGGNLRLKKHFGDFDLLDGFSSLFVIGIQLQRLSQQLLACHFVAVVEQDAASPGQNFRVTTFGLVKFICVCICFGQLVRP